MVWESWYWKLRLKALIAEIETLSEQPDCSDLDTSNLEIAIFTGFFLIRKLVEATTKLSESTENQSVKCQRSSKRPDTPRLDVMNRFDTYKLYDLDSFKNSSCSLRVTCNIFMHSVFLWMVYDDEGIIDGQGLVTGVHLTSDFESEKAIYWFQLDEILRVFRSVVEDEFTEFSMHRDPQSGEWKVRKR